MSPIDELTRKYPRLLRRGYLARSWLNPGWAPIVDRFLADIDELLDDEQARRLIIGKIGEKFGVLYMHADFYERDTDGRLDRLDADSTTARRIQHLLEDARAQSAHTCERCSAASSLQSLAGWATTLCASCRAEQHAELEREVQANAVAALALKHPRLFRLKTPALAGVFPGWRHVVERLFTDIDALLDDERAARFHVGQIGEKLGSLHVQAALRPPGPPDDDEEGPGLSEADAGLNRVIFKLIGQADLQSRSMCLHCGATSSLRDVNGYRTTICDDCLAKDGACETSDDFEDRQRKHLGGVEPPQ